ncbi:hypothetical protein C8Q77DRAFT_1068240 [Trametes polyzona]|nr:hypothetical protein C8Q77DRAFT_1068240 [Trametes polyzona]
MGRFRPELDAGRSYVISEAVWMCIAQETTDAARDQFSAEHWSFWFIYVAPIVLHDRFMDDKYYTHMCDLADIMKVTLQYEVTRTELEDLRLKIISWVRRYEEYYYGYEAERLSACLLVVHGLLHVVDDVLNVGPAWATWTFYMERYCGTLKFALRSRQKPWSNLDKRVTNLAHAAHLSAKFDLRDELLPPRRTYLRAPCLHKYEPSLEIRRRIAHYLVGLVGGKRTVIVNALPRYIPAWGKLRIGGGGDVIRSMIGSRERLGTYERDCSYVRYEVLEHNRQGEEVRGVHYGHLQAVLECALPPLDPMWKGYAGSTLLLAYIKPCKTDGRDATESLVFYKDYSAPIVVDIRSVQAVVGRVKTRGSWGIVDRSGVYARTVFTNESEADVEDADSDNDAGSE